MSITNITISMDTELKEQAEELFLDLGMNLDTAFTIFTKQALREQKIPFTVTRNNNSKTIQAIEDARNGLGLSKPFSNVAELMEDLNADD